MQSQKKVETGKTGQSGATPGGDSGQRKEGGREKGGVSEQMKSQAKVIRQIREKVSILYIINYNRILNSKLAQTFQDVGVSKALTALNFAYCNENSYSTLLFDLPMHH